MGLAHLYSGARMCKNVSLFSCRAQNWSVPREFGAWTRMDWPTFFTVRDTSLSRLCLFELGVLASSARLLPSCCCFFAVNFLPICFTLLEAFCTAELKLLFGFFPTSSSSSSLLESAKVLFRLKLLPLCSSLSPAPNSNRQQQQQQQSKTTVRKIAKGRFAGESPSFASTTLFSSELIIEAAYTIWSWPFRRDLLSEAA